MAVNEGVEKRWAFKRWIVWVNAVPVCCLYVYYATFHQTIPVLILGVFLFLVVDVYFWLFIDKRGYEDSLSLGSVEYRMIRSAITWFYVLFFLGMALWLLIVSLADRGILPNVDSIVLLRNCFVAFADLAAMVNIYALGILYKGDNDLLFKVFLLSAVISFAVTLFPTSLATILAFSALVIYWDTLYLRFKATS
ncbi:MAG: hypothetical protein GX487_09290 [Acetomicrobium flavidum]|uniref:hypothetical protein n=1 Tax=Acetomicrobium flavidum TaxID=49896 RepID=UPI0016BB9FEC|nr:hypothetical protein [Acetomicrobium flavidum]